MPSPTSRPRSLPRRFERWVMGIVMGAAAFFIEKLVMRSIRRSGGTMPKDTSDPTGFTTRGVDIEG